MAVVARAGGNGAGSGSHLALLREALRPGEHTFCFLKQSMGWTTPRVRHPEQADRWSWLIVAAYTQLRLAREGVADLRLPWERRYDADTRLRILQNTNRAESRFRALLSEECAARLELTRA